MGHYWREMDPAGAEEHDNEMAKQMRTKKALAKMKAADFTIEELSAALTFFGIEFSHVSEPHYNADELLKRKLKPVATPRGGE